MAAREVPKDTPNSSNVVRSNITLTNEQIQQTVDGVLAAMAAAEAAARAAAEARARARRKARKAAEEKEAARKAESEREDENNKPRWNTKDPASIQAERDRRQAVLEQFAQQKKEQEVKEKAGQAVAAVADKLLGIASSKEEKSTTTGKGVTGPAGIGGGIAGQVKDALEGVEYSGNKFKFFEEHDFTIGYTDVVPESNATINAFFAKGTITTIYGLPIGINATGGIADIEELYIFGTGPDSPIRFGISTSAMTGNIEAGYNRGRIPLVPSPASGNGEVASVGLVVADKDWNRVVDIAGYVGGPPYGVTGEIRVGDMINGLFGTDYDWVITF